MKNSLPPELFRELGKFDTCSVAYAVDSLRVRLLNEGFAGSGVACRTKALPAMVGAAVTLKVRSSEPPMKRGFYMEQSDWWERLKEEATPRVLVIEDADANPGRGSLMGPVHACIIRAMAFVGVVTNGAVRGTRRFADLGLHAFSGNVSPSHAYCHVIEEGGAVDIAGLRIRSGDLIHGDCDGIVSIPADQAQNTLVAVRRIADRERALCEFCASREFSHEKLRELIRADPNRW